MLKRMAVGENDKICRNIISIVSAAAQSDWLKEQLSKAELSAFGKMIDNTGNQRVRDLVELSRCHH